MCHLCWTEMAKTMVAYQAGKAVSGRSEKVAKMSWFSTPIILFRSMTEGTAEINRATDNPKATNPIFLKTWQHRDRQVTVSSLPISSYPLWY